tara:strand:- start:909 stop:1091 length:183 start_codon:yes stop_codon:yes gene_type:complete
MVSYARARTRSLLSRLWPVSAKNLDNQKVEFGKSKYLIEDIDKQNKNFFEASKNGGIWFS